jgi:hypothetical protein
LTQTPQYILQNQGNKKQQEKEYISKYKKVSKSTKEKKGMVCTSSNSRHLIQPLSHDLFPLEVLLVSVG